MFPTSNQYMFRGMHLLQIHSPTLRVASRSARSAPKLRRVAFASQRWNETFTPMGVINIHLPSYQIFLGQKGELTCFEPYRYRNKMKQVESTCCEWKKVYILKELTSFPVKEVLMVGKVHGACWFPRSMIIAKYSYPPKKQLHPHCMVPNTSKDVVSSLRKKQVSYMFILSSYDFSIGVVSLPIHETPQRMFHRENVSQVDGQSPRINLINCRYSQQDLLQKTLTRCPWLSFNQQE